MDCQGFLKILLRRNGVWALRAFARYSATITQRGERERGGLRGNDPGLLLGEYQQGATSNEKGLLARISNTLWPEI